MMLLKKVHIIFYFLLGGVTLFSCGKESSCLKSTGKLIVEERKLDGIINKIILEDNINLVLTQNNTQSLKVEGGGNLLPHIETEKNGTTLKIGNDNKCNFLRSYKKSITVYLSVANINEINYTGKGNIISSDTLNFPNFTIDCKNATGSVNLFLNSDQISLISHTGATDFNLKGNTNNLYVFNGSNSWFYLSQLSANSVHINSGGTGDVIVNSTNSLLVELTSLGNIIYNGNPIVTVSVNTGNGELIKQ